MLLIQISHNVNHTFPELKCVWIATHCQHWLHMICIFTMYFRRQWFVTDAILFCSEALLQTHPKSYHRHHRCTLALNNNVGQGHAHRGVLGDRNSAHTQVHTPPTTLTQPTIARQSCAGVRIRLYQHAFVVEFETVFWKCETPKVLRETLCFCVGFSGILLPVFFWPLAVRETSIWAPPQPVKLVPLKSIRNCTLSNVLFLGWAFTAAVADVFLAPFQYVYDRQLLFSVCPDHYGTPSSKSTY